MSKFWWGYTGERKGTYWKSWNCFCYDKAVGGFGFRDLGIFNDVKLVK